MPQLVLERRRRFGRAEGNEGDRHSVEELLALWPCAVLDGSGLGGYELRAMRGVNKSGWMRWGNPALGALLVALAFLLCASTGWSIPDGKEHGLGNLLSVQEGDEGAISRTYDGLNRVTSYTEAAGLT